MIKYTVIIPIFNADNTITNCINSILVATKDRNDTEILLINDGSTDNSDVICQDFLQKSKYIKYIKKENGGVSSARNIGIDNANGKYLLFVDSDDSVSSDYFKTIDDVINKYDYDYVIFGSSLCANGKIKRISHNKHKESLIKNRTINIISRLIVDKTINSPFVKVYKRDIVLDNDIIFLEELSIAEDWNFNIRYALNIESIYVSNDCIYNVNLDNDNSLSRKKYNEDKRKQIEIARRDVRENVINSKLLEDNINTILSSLDFGKISNVYSQAKIDYKKGLSKKERKHNTNRRCKEISEGRIKCPRYLYCYLVAIPVKLHMCMFINFFAEFLVNRY